MKETRRPDSLDRRPLARQVSRGAQIARTFALALPLAALATAGLVYADETLFLVVAGAFGLVSLLPFWSAMHQLFALRTPETVVEIDAGTLKRGAEVQMWFRQPGSASFESLRANLVGEERWFERAYSRRRVRKVRQLGTFNIFDSGPFDAPFEQTVRVRVPDLPRADKTRGEHWRLEVWGKVRGRADVQHVFPVEVER